MSNLTENLFYEDNSVKVTKTKDKKRRKTIMYKQIIIAFILLIASTLIIIAGCGGDGGGGGILPVTDSTAIPTSIPTGTSYTPLPTQIPTAIPQIPTAIPTYTPNATSQTIQQQIDSNGGGWKAGNNPIASLPEEKKKQLCGCDLSKSATGLSAYNLSGKGLPSSFSRSEYLTSIKDQGNAGTCVAFAAVASLEGLIKIKSNEPSRAIDLSEAHLFTYGGGNCVLGWFLSSAATYLKNTGVPPEEYFPYNPSTVCSGSSKAGWENYVVKIKEWQNLNSGDAMKDYIYNYGPIMGRFNVYEDFFYYNSGVYRHIWGNFAGGHAICIYGWDDNTGCWLAKNSWGYDWGERGTFKIAYNQCNINDYAIGMSYEVSTPTPVPTFPPVATFTPGSPTPTSQVILPTSTSTVHTLPTSTPTSPVIQTSTPTRTPTTIPTAANTPTPTSAPFLPGMVPVNGGTFYINVPANSMFITPTPVGITVSGFYMGKYEVTNKEYAVFLNSEGNQNEGLFISPTWWKNVNDIYNGIIDTGVSGPGRFTVKSGYENHPVVYISWYGAVAYCNWLSQKEGFTQCYGPKNSRGIPSEWRTKNGYRLPTEAEWEYACRGGTNSKFYWGDAMNGAYCWYRYNSNGNHQEVGKKIPNPFGLYDMSGNVVEWCNDWFDGYSATNPETYINPVGPPSSPGYTCIWRGGDFSDYENSCESSFRAGNETNDRFESIGFRLVRNR